MFQVGERARVINNVCHHGFKNGQIVTISKLDRQGRVWSAQRKNITWNMIDDELQKIEPKKFSYKKLADTFCTIGFFCIFAMILLGGGVEYHRELVTYQVRGFLITCGVLVICTIGMVWAQVKDAKECINSKKGDHR